MLDKEWALNNLVTKMQWTEEEVLREYKRDPSTIAWCTFMLEAILGKEAKQKYPELFI